MRRSAALTVMALVALTASCASNNRKYDWGKYDPSLYAYYKDPVKLAQLSEALAAIISSSEKGHSVVPPGIYAEYGYLQMQQGNSQQAVGLFQQEETHWPESKPFMDRMIKVASMPASSPSSQGTAQ